MLRSVLHVLNFLDWLVLAVAVPALVAVEAWAASARRQSLPESAELARAFACGTAMVATAVGLLLLLLSYLAVRYSWCCLR